MASRQRARAPKKQRTPNTLTDLGIFDIPNLDMMDVGEDVESDVDESALESELEAILSGRSATKPSRPKKKVAPPLDIETMAAECMKDFDEEEDENDESLLNDPDLLKELKSLSFERESPVNESAPEDVNLMEEKPKQGVPSEPPKTEDIVTLLELRLKLYNEAISASKALNETSKVRRYGRALKTLEQLLKSAKSGKPVNEEEIPPPVSIPKAKPPEPKLLPDPSPEVSVPVTDNVPTENLIDINESPKEESLSKDIRHLMVRRDKYKVAALEAKRAGDKATALNYMKISKSFDAVIAAAKNNEPVDLSNIPPSPPPYQGTIAAVSDPPKKEHDETQTSSIQAAALSAASEPEDPALFAAPPAPTSVLEGLHQRLEKFKTSKAAAEAEGNTSKARRLDRIVKSYIKAIKDYQAGKHVEFEELPVPPGFAPLPVPEESLKPNIPSSNKTEIENKRTEEKRSPTVPKRPAPEMPPKAASQRPKVQRANTSTLERQLDFLLERQKLFRQAALASKKNGDIEQAKNYLRQSKGFDSMIEATRSGLPIDASSIPTPPQLEQSDFEVVDVAECVPDDGDSFEMLETLEKDLTKQIQICCSNKEHFLKLGDVSSASKFEKLGLESKKDLSVIRHLKKTGQSAPKFHYEIRKFSIVESNTHLSDSELEVTVERGINLPGKPDIDTYVTLDLPIPSSDAPQRAKTHTIRDSNNPIYQEEFKFEFSRKSRAQLRQFKRGILKLCVWSKGGFLRSDTLLGTANVKLVDLESKCSIHDSFELMDGRKACGGQLEVKVRIRNPLLVKQVEEVQEKWLVIGS